MCKNLFSKDDGASAAQANSQALAAQTAKDTTDAEAARQASVRAGQSAIDTNFSQFNDPYYGGFKQTYLDAYNPQVDTQYQAAKGSAVAALADRGVLDSSIAGNALGKLTDAYGTARGQIAGQADDAVRSLKGQVNDAKSNLYALNTGATDPSQIANQANASATSLIPNAPTSPLGDIFAGALTPILTAQKVNAYSANPYGASGSNFGVAPGSSSSSIIR